MSACKENLVPLPVTERNNPVITGTVEEVSSDTSTIRVSGVRVQAQKAFSCFTAPQVEDTVICCRNEFGNFYILGIMERRHTGRTKITLPGDTSVDAGGGDIRITSEETVTMAGKNLNFFSGETVHKSNNATISFENTTATGNTLIAKYNTISILGNLISTLARQAIGRFKTYMRHTENSDRLKAGSAARTVKGLYGVDTGHTIMTSKESTKIDGKKILMG